MIGLRSYPDWPPKTHTPAVSHTSLEMYDRCRRKWAYQYLCDFLREPLRSEVKIQKAMKSLSSLPGSIFHQTIDRASQLYAQTGEWPADLVAIARECFNGYVDFSTRTAESIRRGQGAPFGDEYGAIDEIVEHGRLRPEVARSVASKVKNWLETFGGFARRELLVHPSEFWMLPKVGPYIAKPWFWDGAAGDVPVYAVHDLAIWHGDGVTIYDWKTGKHCEAAVDAAKEQLTCYAAYAIRTWNVALDEIEAVVYWVDTGEVLRTDIPRSWIDDAVHEWDLRHAVQMSDKGAVQSIPSSFFERFPITNDLFACRFCPFKSCEGYARVRGLSAGSAVEDPFDEIAC